MTSLLMCGVPTCATAQTVTSSPTVASHNGRSGAVRGTVTDQSGGVLPGVTVTATSADGRQLQIAVSNATGEFSIDSLPVGAIELHFHLDGFDDSKATVTIQPAGPGVDARVAHQLALPARTEMVTVRADPPPAPPVPRPVIATVAEHDQDSVCGPAKAETVVPAQGTIRSRRDESSQGMFAAGDELLIEGGAFTGLRVGQNFVVRRRYSTALTNSRGVPVMGEHSSGVLQIVSVQDRASTAVVVYACDEMMSGDYLAPFQPEPIRVPDAMGTPAFEMAARILFADDGQLVGVTRRMMVIDRGARHGMQPGQRVTLFRRSRFGSSAPAIVGEAVVVAVRRESSTVRVEHSTDVIFFGEGGDWAAPQHPSQRASN